MAKISSLDVILAGGKGERLWPITRDRAKPAAPFGGKYRIIDFVLSNHFNSGSRNIVVLVQYKPASLKRHIENAWKKSFEREGSEFIKTISPGHDEYRATANAVYKNIELIKNAESAVVTVFAGDHVYLMNISQMKKFHLDSRADLTIAGTPVPKNLAAGNLGVIVTNQRGDVTGFEEKVVNPTEIPWLPGFCWASMGNYVFSQDVLSDALNLDAGKPYVPPKRRELVVAHPDLYTSNDFGFDIIPMLIRQGKRIKMYNFRDNRPDMIPITGYWRDVGTLDQFVEANMDITGSNPVLALENPGWPLTTYDESHGKQTIGADLAVGSVLAKGVENKGHLRRCVVSYQTAIGEGADVEDSIMMGHNAIGKNAVVRNAVIDRGVRIPDRMKIDMSPEEAASKGFIMSRGGYVFIPRNYEFRS